MKDTTKQPITAEEFFRNKLQAYAGIRQVMALSQEMITAEQGLRWAHEYKEYCIGFYKNQPAKTLLDCKNEVARNSGYDSWDKLYENKLVTYERLFCYLSDATKLFESQFTSTEKELVNSEGRGQLLEFNLTENQLFDACLKFGVCFDMRDSPSYTYEEVFKNDFLPDFKLHLQNANPTVTPKEPVDKEQGKHLLSTCMDEFAKSMDYKDWADLERRVGHIPSVYQTAVEEAQKLYNSTLPSTVSNSLFAKKSPMDQHIEDSMNEFIKDNPISKEYKTAEEILTKLSNEHENKYVSFPALVENEGSVEVYELVCNAIHAYHNQFTPEDSKEDNLKRQYWERNFRVLRGAMDTILFESKEPHIKVYAQSALDQTKDYKPKPDPQEHCKEHNWHGEFEEKCPLCNPKTAVTKEDSKGMLSGEQWKDKYVNLIQLINNQNPAMIEQFQRHDYRLMYEIWESIVNFPESKELPQYKGGEEIEKIIEAAKEFMVATNVRFPSVSIDDPKSMACYEAYHKLNKLIEQYKKQ